MHDLGVPDTRPPYWAKCEKMGFTELYRFIDRAVEKRSDPSALGHEDLPRSEEEFIALIDMLKAKADALKEEAPMPERPTYDGPGHPGPFTPSYELRSLYNRLERYERRVDEAIEGGGSPIYIEYVRDELKKVEQEVAPVEESERREQEQRLAEYREARTPYLDRLRLWEAEEARRREAEANRDEIVRRMYRKVKRAAVAQERPSSSKHVINFHWEFAAPGERTHNRVVYDYFREVLRRGRLKRFDQDRLHKILALPRSGILRGRPGAGRYGYIALTFDHTEKVLMDCPAYGNALFVLDSAEERLLKMNKQELIASDEVGRIFHTKNWYARVREALEISPDNGSSAHTDDPDTNT